MKALTDCSVKNIACKLEILEQCTSPNLHMPSWVPDWNNKNRFRLFSGRSTYHAVLDRPPVFSFSTDNTELFVEGFKIGVIGGMGASYYETMPSTEAHDLLVQSTGSINAYKIEDGLREAIWRTLIGNRVPQIAKKVAPESQSALLQCPLQLEKSTVEMSRGRKAFQHLLKQNKDLKVAGEVLSGVFPASGTEDPKEIHNSLEQIFRFHRSRRLAITPLDHFGVVPIPTRTSDVVYIFLGCKLVMSL